jgi:hypothetical protein
MRRSPLIAAKAVLSTLALLTVMSARADDALRLPDQIPGPEQETTRTALYDAYASARYACESGKSDGGRTLSKNQQANNCFEADRIDKWVTAQGGCINDAWAAILTAAECREVEECVNANGLEACD